LAPILISFSHRLVNGHGSAVLGQPHEVAEIVGQSVELKAGGVGGVGEQNHGVSSARRRNARWSF
jgi:hypothetical protein